MAAKKSDSTSALSKGRFFLFLAIIFVVGYLAGMNHDNIKKCYIDSEPQRKEVGLKTLEYSKIAFDKTVEGTKSTFRFIGEKFEAMGKTQAKK